MISSIGGQTEKAFKKSLLLPKYRYYFVEIKLCGVVGSQDLFSAVPSLVKFDTAAEATATAAELVATTAITTSTITLLA